MNQELALREDQAVAIYELETRFAMATRQRALLETYIKERLKPDKHYYTFGGDDSRKPSLTKEGAELIALPHALKAHYEWISGPANPPLDDAPYQITMKCSFESSGGFAGEGIGSASSMVTKNRDDGSKVRVQRQNDPGLRHNATIKMACKSAYIAATLNATAASEFFTQDMEDDTGAAPKAPKDKSQHWCTAHNTPFFKRGQMKHYAHPIEGTKDWCNEPSSAPQKAAQPQQKAAAKAQAEKDAEELGYPPELEEGGPLTEPAQADGYNALVAEVNKLLDFDCKVLFRNLSLETKRDIKSWGDVVKHKLPSANVRATANKVKEGKLL